MFGNLYRIMQLKFGMIMNGNGKLVIGALGVRRVGKRNAVTSEMTVHWTRKSQRSTAVMDGAEV